jgi:ribosomal protein S27E
MEQNAKEEDNWGPRRLPVLHLSGRAYFVDLRLHELWATDDPHARIDLRSPAGWAQVADWKAIHCPTCGQPAVVRRDSPKETLACPRCGQTVVVQGGEALAWSAPGHADRLS